jgi:ankyrin repeat protein
MSFLLTVHGYSKESESTKNLITAKTVLEQEADQFIKILMQYSNIVNAAHAHDLSAVALFLKNGANPNERGNIGSEKYEWGDRRGHHVIINEGMTCLDIATRTSDLSMTILLLEHGADATLFRKVQFNSRTNPNYHKKDIDEPYFGQFSPIYVVLKNKDCDLLKIFSDFGADFNKICITGNEQRPLDVAITDKNYEAAAILIEGGAKP